MAKSNRDPRSANLTLEQMRISIPKIERRIKDLETFDIQTIRNRWDPTIEALTKKVDGTLQEILGHDTIEFKDYEIYSLDTLPLIMGGGENPLSEVHQGYREGVERAVLKLKTLKELFEERIADGSPSPAGNSASSARRAEGVGRVFIVHGHDEGVKETVARFVSKLDLKPIILHEQPNQGKTVIEKFESHSDVEYAVILFSPDDMGYPKDDPSQLRARPRQNVVLELGFFLGALGRKRVCVLYRGDVEIPSDYSGVLYVPIDDAGAWRFKLASEMKSIGISVDLNKVI